MTTLKLTIQNMKSSHCQMTVSDTIKSNGGIVKSIAPMEATIEVESESQQEAILQAVINAGYRAELV